MNAEQMYQEIILDHYRHPKNFGKIENATIKERDVNPACGDVIEMTLCIKENKVEDIKFTGKGCAISQASASMLTEDVKRKSLKQVKNIQKEDILKMLGIELSGMRLKCALLALKVLKLGVYKYEGEKNDF